MADVFCGTGGANKIERTRLQRRTHFDRLLMAVVDEVSLPLARPAVDSASLRDAAKYAYGSALLMSAGLGSPHRFSRPLFDTPAICSRNFAVLLADIIPARLQARNGTGSNTKVLLADFGGMEDRYRELLSIYGITPTYELASALEFGRITLLPDTYSRLNFKSAADCDRVFLARRNARSLLNHPRVAAGRVPVSSSPRMRRSGRTYARRGCPLRAR